jgi:hypothetical protein
MDEKILSVKNTDWEALTGDSQHFYIGDVVNNSVSASLSRFIPSLNKVVNIRPISQPPSYFITITRLKITSI